MPDRIRIRVDASEPVKMIESAVRACEPPLITNAVRAAAKVYHDGARRRAPRDTGALQQSIQITQTGDDSFEIGTDLIYGPVQEYGAVIKPRNAAALRFMIGSQVVFAKKVVIPPSPYINPTFEQDTPDAEDAFQREFEQNIQI